MTYAKKKNELIPRLASICHTYLPSNQHHLPASSNYPTQRLFQHCAGAISKPGGSSIHPRHCKDKTACQVRLETMSKITIPTRAITRHGQVIPVRTNCPQSRPKIQNNENENDKMKWVRGQGRLVQMSVCLA